jgi:hypothetical protein
MSEVVTQGTDNDATRVFFDAGQFRIAVMSTKMLGCTRPQVQHRAE